MGQTDVLGNKQTGVGGISQSIDRGTSLPNKGTSLDAISAQYIQDFLELYGGDAVNFGAVDVIRDYYWSIKSASQRFLGEVPSVELTEYELKNNPTTSGLQYIWRLAGAGLDATEDVVKGMSKDNQRKNAHLLMYQGTLKTTYTFPYFNQFNHVLNQGWDVASTDFLTKAANEVSKFASIASNQYGGINTLKKWTGSEDGASFQFSFQLFNTLSSDPNSVIYKNYNLVRGLIYNNLPNKTGPFTLTPPVIYSVNIPGVKWIPLAYVSLLTVENVGQVNRKVLKTSNGKSLEVNVPDAWNININITELTPETRNIYEGAFESEKGSRVNVINIIG